MISSRTLESALSPRAALSCCGKRAGKTRVEDKDVKSDKAEGVGKNENGRRGDRGAGDSPAEPGGVFCSGVLGDERCRAEGSLTVPWGVRAAPLRRANRAAFCSGASRLASRVPGWAVGPA